MRSFIAAVLLLTALQNALAQDHKSATQPFITVMEAEAFEWIGPEYSDKFANVAGASLGTCLKLRPDAVISTDVPIPVNSNCYVYVRCPARESYRKINVRIGNAISDAVGVSADDGPGFRWARVGPFTKKMRGGSTTVTIRTSGDVVVWVDQVAITTSPKLSSMQDAMEIYPKLKFYTIPSPEFLDSLETLDTYPTSYVIGNCIVNAPEEWIAVAVGWVEFMQKETQPTMYKILGYTPALDTYSFVFQYDYPTNPAVYIGTGEFYGTGIITHRICVRCDKLYHMPPYVKSGGITWETIHAFLNDPKKQADWSPIWQTELLDYIFELELFKRLKMQSDLDWLWEDVTAQPGSRLYVFGEFWREYGWKPFQYLLLKLHNYPGYRPVLDESTFVHEMSLGAKKDVSAFFEQYGWVVTAETKEKIKQELDKANTEN